MMVMNNSYDISLLGHIQLEKWKWDLSLVKPVRLENEAYLPYCPSRWWHKHPPHPERRWGHKRAALALTRSPVTSASRGRCHDLYWRRHTEGALWPEPQFSSAGSARHRGECQRQCWRRRQGNRRHWKSLGQIIKYTISHYLSGQW